MSVCAMEATSRECSLRCTLCGLNTAPQTSCSAAGRFAVRDRSVDGHQMSALHFLRPL